MATTQIEKKTEAGLGTAGHADLREQFARTLDDYHPSVVEEIQNSMRDGVQAGNPDVGALDMDYSDAPTIEKFHPDRGWPEGGTTNPADITDGPPAKSSGEGSTVSPSETASSISKQKIGELIRGSSSPG